MYVDDLHMVKTKLSEVEEIKAGLKKDATDLDEVKGFLGCQVRSDREKGVISLSCILKIGALVEKFGLSEGAKATDKPISKDFVASQLPCAPKGEDTLGAGVP